MNEKCVAYSSTNGHLKISSDNVPLIWLPLIFSRCKRRMSPIADGNVPLIMFDARFLEKGVNGAYVIRQ